jgi:hypothetical protein
MERNSRVHHAADQYTHQTAAVGFLIVTEDSVGEWLMFMTFTGGARTGRRMAADERQYGS